MRFIRQEHLITTICNQEITDDKIITRVLSNLLKGCIEFSLSYNKLFQSDYTSRIMYYSKVKVKEVHENTVDFFILTQGVTVIKGIEFGDLGEIKAITTKHDILKIKPDATRFDLMDIEEDEV